VEVPLVLDEARVGLAAQEIDLHVDPREVLDEVSSKVAAPRFAEHMRPYLAGPASRSVGEVVVDVSY
jgi:hypothetical protein